MVRVTSTASFRDTRTLGQIRSFDCVIHRVLDDPSRLRKMVRKVDSKGRFRAHQGRKLL